jgi:hypothetical protein
MRRRRGRLLHRRRMVATIDVMVTSNRVVAATIRGRLAR